MLFVMTPDRASALRAGIDITYRHVKDISIEHFDSVALEWLAHAKGFETLDYPPRQETRPSPAIDLDLVYRTLESLPRFDGRDANYFRPEALTATTVRQVIAIDLQARARLAKAEKEAVRQGARFLASVFTDTSIDPLLEVLSHQGLTCAAAPNTAMTIDLTLADRLTTPLSDLALKRISDAGANALRAFEHTYPTKALCHWSLQPPMSPDARPLPDAEARHRLRLPFFTGWDGVVLDRKPAQFLRSGDGARCPDEALLTLLIHNSWAADFQAWEKKIRQDHSFSYATFDELRDVFRSHTGRCVPNSPVPPCLIACRERELVLPMVRAALKRANTSAGRVLASIEGRASAEYAKALEIAEGYRSEIHVILSEALAEQDRQHAAATALIHAYADQHPEEVILERERAGVLPDHERQSILRRIALAAFAGFDLQQGPSSSDAAPSGLAADRSQGLSADEFVGLNALAKIESPHPFTVEVVREPGGLEPPASCFRVAVTLCGSTYVASLACPLRWEEASALPEKVS